MFSLVCYYCEGQGTVYGVTLAQREPSLSQPLGINWMPVSIWIIFFFTSFCIDSIDSCISQQTRTNLGREAQRTLDRRHRL